MGRARALEVMLSADDYDAELAERYGWINRALPANALGDFVRSLAHRIAGFPAAGLVVVKERVNAIALAPAEDFRRDSDLFGEGVRNPEAQSASKPRSSAASRPETRKWPWAGCWASWPTVDRQADPERTMLNLTYDKQLTALLVIDPYNDFISEGGKVWDRLKGVAEANKCVPHMVQVLDAARKADIRVFYALHRRYRPGDYESWKYIAPIQKAAWSRKTFEYGTWGARSAANSRRNRATSWPLSIGVPVVSPTPTWTCS